MKKVIIGVTVIAAIILCGVGFQQLLNFGENLYTVTSHEYQQSQRTQSYVKFQAVSENTDLLNSVLKVNEGFLKNPPLEKKNTKKIGNAYILHNFFPSFSSYYTAKRKIENTIFIEMQDFYEEIAGLSETQLKSYFDTNSAKIKDMFMITDWDSFDLFCLSLSAIGDSKINDAYVVENSVLYNSYDASSVFNIVIVLENNQKFQLGVTASFENSIPEIQYNGSFGGVFE